MKKIIPVIIAAAVSFTLTSCVEMITIRGNGVTAEKTIAFDQGYREISVSGGIRVVLSPSLSDRAEVVADEQVMEYLVVAESGGKVKVAYKPNVVVRSKIETVVTLPMSAYVSALKVSSSSKLHADNLILTKENVDIDCSSSGRIRARIESPQVKVNVSSSAGCDLDILCGVCSIAASSSGKFKGRITARELSVGVSSSGGCTVEGECDALSIDASSSGSFKGAGLRAGKVHIDGSSSADADVWAVDELGVSLSSAATVRYKGDPSITSNSISSGATLKKAD